MNNKKQDCIIQEKIQKQLAFRRIQTNKRKKTLHIFNRIPTPQSTQPTKANLLQILWSLQTKRKPQRPPHPRRQLQQTRMNSAHL